MLEVTPPTGIIHPLAPIAIPVELTGGVFNTIDR